MPARFTFLLLWLLACLLAVPLGAQAPARPMKKSELKELAATQSLLSLRKYPEAQEKLDRLLRRHGGVADLHYLQAEIGRGEKDYPKALAALERGIALEGPAASIAYRELAEVHAQMGNYTEALDAYESYLAALQRAGRSPDQLKAVEERVAEARVAAELAANPLAFTPEPLGPGVNTPDHLEYFPSLSVDGQRMIFTRRVNKQQEDFYQSNRLPDGSWDRATPLDGVNTPLNEGAQTITADGRYLVFTGCGRRDGAGSCDLYFSERQGDRWTEAQNMGATINTRASESQPSLSQDGRLLFFASNRAGGMGNDDIYVAGRNPDGSWSRPVNLGPSINTSGNDRYPFWAADNRTLYFTSTGRRGMGGADLFKTSVDENNMWEQPTNLGYPLNTAGEETNLFIALDGKTAFFSKGVGDDIDIYTFEMPEKIRPAPATYVQVSVVDDQTDQPLVANVRLQTQDKKGLVSSSQTDRHGCYLTVLPTGRDYGFTVEKEGYLFYSDRFELTGEHTVSEPFLLKIRLQPLLEEDVSEAAEADGAIVLKNVFFETASDELLELSTEELDRLVALLNSQPQLGVEIAGHTDDVGSEAANQRLSERRAASVKTYLESQGIAPDRIRSVGYGESRPVAPNDTEAGRARNRRTTFRLLF
ncbi:outer membrane protein OmpA-like peptidoglycan-associated protein [Lewinella marina]|uniref:Flagellar motor protein MotB n=1 Tax=Neolewinella marina TaxID=438751 RepID=A0A2G0CCW7_9BACT|nr:OmpA family protein [Neolewinella marina]NJB87005.1 outer membrane protein OmpA-like peptidoglycan-associated protein [Neolewinella marina]PHK97802.1 flagellar motor protein MotB [Neolewinella marina]